MKCNKIILTGVLAMTTFFSCEEISDIENLNTNPNNFTDAPANLLLAQSQLISAKITEGNSARIANVFTDQFTGDDRQYVTIQNYGVTMGDFSDDWTDIYVGIAQTRLAKEKAVADGNKILEGVSEIFEGLLFGEAAALWGDIPYTEALQDLKFPNPNYDSQKEVLTKIQESLSNGALKAGDVKVENAYGDKVLTSPASWKKVAHSLKARYFLIAKDYTNALKEAKLGLSSKAEDVLILHEDSDGARNLYYQFTVMQRAGYMNVRGSYLQQLLTGAKPRVLNTPGDANRAKVYFDGDNLNGTGYFSPDSNFPLISYYEVKLIEAEAAYRTGDELAAQKALNEVRSELAIEYSGDFPASTATGETLLKQILEEKYITLVGSIQNFHDVRRTDNLIGVPIKVNTATKLPQRFLYPEIEYNSNDNFPGVIDLYEKTPVNK